MLNLLKPDLQKLIQLQNPPPILLISIPPHQAIKLRQPKQRLLIIIDNGHRINLPKLLEMSPYLLLPFLFDILGLDGETAGCSLLGGD